MALMIVHKRVWLGKPREFDSLKNQDDYERKQGNARSQRAIPGAAKRYLNLILSRLGRNQHLPSIFSRSRLHYLAIHFDAPRGIVEKMQNEISGCRKICGEGFAFGLPLGDFDGRLRITFNGYLRSRAIYGGRIGTEGRVFVGAFVSGV